MSKKKYCPFLTKVYDPERNMITGILCVGEECMAWGIVGTNVTDDLKINTIPGCKLIPEDKW